MTSRLRRTTVTVFCAAGLLATYDVTIHAQAVATSFDEFRAGLKAPVSAEVTTLDGARVKGVIRAVEPSHLRLDVGGRTIDIGRDQVRRVETRRRDSLLNGVLIGAVAGAALGLIPDYYDDCEECHDSLYASTAVGAGVGLLIDALRLRRRVVYQSPTTARSMRFEVAIGRQLTGFRAIVRWR